MPAHSPATDRSTWQSLMRPALAIVDSLEALGYGELAFRFGGGTALMLRWDHRISKDIDLFIHDAQALGYLTPRLNELTGQLAQQYAEAANALKVQMSRGDIDFIVAADVFPWLEPGVMSFDERNIKVERSEEILGKKILYRADSFKPRDVFDMAAGLARDPDAVGRALRATRPVHATLDRRLSDLKDLRAEHLMQDIIPTDVGRTYFGGMLDRVRSALNDVMCEDVGKPEPETIPPARPRRGGHEL